MDIFRKSLLQRSMLNVFLMRPAHVLKYDQKKIKMEVIKINGCDQL